MSDETTSTVPTTTKGPTPSKSTNADAFDRPFKPTPSILSSPISPESGEPSIVVSSDVSCFNDDKYDEDRLRRDFELIQIGKNLSSEDDDDVKEIQIISMCGITTGIRFEDDDTLSKDDTLPVATMTVRNDESTDKYEETTCELTENERNVAEKMSPSSELTDNLSICFDLPTSFTDNEGDVANFFIDNAPDDLKELRRVYEILSDELEYLRDFGTRTNFSKDFISLVKQTIRHFNASEIEYKRTMDNNQVVERDDFPIVRMINSKKQSVKEQLAHIVNLSSVISLKEIVSLIEMTNKRFKEDDFKAMLITKFSKTKSKKFKLVLDVFVEFLQLLFYVISARKTLKKKRFLDILETYKRYYYYKLQIPIDQEDKVVDARGICKVETYFITKGHHIQRRYTCSYHEITSMPKTKPPSDEDDTGSYFANCKLSEEAVKYDENSRGLKHQMGEETKIVNHFKRVDEKLPISRRDGGEESRKENDESSEEDEAVETDPGSSNQSDNSDSDPTPPPSGSGGNENGNSDGDDSSEDDEEDSDDSDDDRSDDNDADDDETDQEVEPEESELEPDIEEEEETVTHESRGTVTELTDDGIVVDEDESSSKSSDEVVVEIKNNGDDDDDDNDGEAARCVMLFSDDVEDSRSLEDQIAECQTKVYMYERMCRNKMTLEENERCLKAARRKLKQLQRERERTQKKTSNGDTGSSTSSDPVYSAIKEFDKSQEEGEEEVCVLANVDRTDDEVPSFHEIMELFDRERDADNRYSDNDEISRMITERMQSLMRSLEVSEEDANVSSDEGSAASDLYSPEYTERYDDFQQTVVDRARFMMDLRDFQESMMRFAEHHHFLPGEVDLSYQREPVPLTVHAGQTSPDELQQRYVFEEDNNKSAVDFDCYDSEEETKDNNDIMRMGKRFNRFIRFLTSLEHLDPKYRRSRNNQEINHPNNEELKKNVEPKDNELYLDNAEKISYYTKNWELGGFAEFEASQRQSENNDEFQSQRQQFENNDESESQRQPENNNESNLDDEELPYYPGYWERIDVKELMNIPEFSAPQTLPENNDESESQRQPENNDESQSQRQFENNDESESQKQPENNDELNLDDEEQPYYTGYWEHIDIKELMNNFPEFSAPQTLPELNDESENNDECCLADEEQLYYDDDYGELINDIKEQPNLPLPENNDESENNDECLGDEEQFYYDDDYGKLIDIMEQPNFVTSQEQSLQPSANETQELTAKSTDSLTLEQLMNSFCDKLTVYDSFLEEFQRDLKDFSECLRLYNQIDDNDKEEQSDEDKDERDEDESKINSENETKTISDGDVLENCELQANSIDLNPPSQKEIENINIERREQSSDITGDKDPNKQHASFNEDCLCSYGSKQFTEELEETTEEASSISTTTLRKSKDIESKDTDLTRQEMSAESELNFEDEAESIVTTDPTQGESDVKSDKPEDDTDLTRKRSIIDEYADYFYTPDPSRQYALFDDYDIIVDDGWCIIDSSELMVSEEVTPETSTESTKQPDEVTPEISTESSKQPDEVTPETSTEWSKQPDEVTPETSTESTKQPDEVTPETSTESTKQPDEPEQNTRDQPMSLADYADEVLLDFDSLSNAVGLISLGNITTVNEGAFNDDIEFECGFDAETIKNLEFDTSNEVYLGPSFPGDGKLPEEWNREKKSAEMKLSKSERTKIGKDKDNSPACAVEQRQDHLVQLTQLPEEWNQEKKPAEIKLLKSENTIIGKNNFPASAVGEIQQHCICNDKILFKRSVGIVDHRPPIRKHPKKRYQIPKTEEYEYKEPTQKLFRCSLCPESFEIVNDLITHTSNSHPEHFFFVCNICQKVFMDKEIFEQHNSNAHVNKSDVEQPSTSLHSNRNDDDSDVIACKICGEVFRSLEELEKHMKIHIREEKVAKPDDNEKSSLR